MRHLIEQTKSLTAGVLALVFAMGLVTLGVLSWTDAQAAVENTRHNLSSSNTITDANSYSGTASVCVFCHTPHGGAANGVSVPLWNRNVGAPTGGYTTYATLQTSTLDGEEAPVGSVSIACLSCHDGTQAMDTLLNEPGSGTTNAAFQGGGWSGTNNTAGQISAGLITNVGADLTNDHPIGIQYGGGGKTQGANEAAATNDPDFAATSAITINNTTMWWVDTGTTGVGTRQKTDMLLYTRDIGNGNEPFVECASCHDPHVENVGGLNPTFLRTSNAGSAVCLACHTK